MSPVIMTPNPAILVPALTVLIQDSFTAADNTNNAGRTPDVVNNGNTWAATHQSTKITSNKLRGDGLDDVVLVDTARTSYTVEVDLTINTQAAGSEVGFLVLSSGSATNGVLIDYEKATHRYAIYGSGENGSPTYSTTTVTALSDNTTYHLKAVVDGTAHTVDLYQDGVQIGTTTTVGSESGTKAGLYIKSNGDTGSSYSLDNFTVSY